MRLSTSDRTPSRTSMLLLFGAALVGGIAGGVIWASRSRAAKTLQSHHDRIDEHRDRTLHDSFPASDAPATHDYAIPINAR